MLTPLSTVKLDRSVIALVEKCSVTLVGVSYLLVLSCVAVGESGMPVYKAVVPCLAFIRNGLSPL